MQDGIRTKVALGCGAALAIQLAIIAFSYVSLQGLIEADRWENHAYDATRKLQALQGDLTDAETSRRGYILAGDEKQLDTFLPAVTKVGQDIAELRKLTADNPEQLRRLDALEPVTNGKLAHLRESIELQRSKGSDPAAQAIFTVQGKTLMDQIRQRIGVMIAEEDGLLARRSQSKATIERITFAVIALGLLFSVGLFFLAYRLLRREIAERVQAQANLSRSNEELEKKLGEIKRLYWLLEKVEDVVPICMECGKVKTAKANWKDIVQYLKENKLLLSHGYCPECAAKVRVQLGLK